VLKTGPNRLDEHLQRNQCERMKQMAQDDREKIKATLDGGYTPIANLLLEALAAARLKGIEKGICLFLWRRTYGWGRTEDCITLREFALACATSVCYISRQLKELVDRRVVLRTSYQPGKAATYTFNTRIDQWDQNCLDVQGLHNGAKQGLHNSAIQGLHNRAKQGLHNGAIQGLHNGAIQGLHNSAIQGLHNGARVDTPQAQAPQGFAPSLKKDQKNIKKNIKKNIYPPTPLKGGALETDPGIKQVLDYYHDMFVAQFGERPVINGRKDGAIVKSLLQTRDLDQLLGLLDAFFASPDPWIKQSGYTLGVFKSQINKLLTQAKGGSGGGRDSPAGDGLDDIFIN